MKKRDETEKNKNAKTVDVAFLKNKNAKTVDVAFFDFLFQQNLRT